MSEAKKKPEKFISPKGTMVYPWLNKPDTKFKAEGEYRCRLRVPADNPDCEKLVARLEKQHDAFIKKVKADPKRKNKKLPTEYKAWAMELDEDGNETGFVLFNFKRKASGTKKDGTPWAIKPDLFDAHGQKLDPSVQVYGGSIGKVSFTIEPYALPLGMGLALRLEGAQVIKLVEGQGRSASSYGFGDESDDEDADSTDADSSDDESSDDDEDSDAENGDEF